jgi:hypothetical protein
MLVPFFPIELHRLYADRSDWGITIGALSKGN